MKDLKLNEAIKIIESPCVKAASLCRARWNQIGKPLYGLGELEEYLVQIAAIRGTSEVSIRKKALVVFCADHGVMKENVSQSGQELTAVVAENYLDRKTCASLMSEAAGVDLFPLDIGIICDTPRLRKIKCRCGTGNIAEGPAMTKKEAVFAIEAGIQIAGELKEQGYSIVASGETGMGNSTISAALVSVLLGKDPAKVTGRGSGLSDEGLKRKISVIRSSIKINHPNPKDPLDTLARIGGLDIAGMAGLCIGCAVHRLPVVADGLISLTAALVAVRLAPLCRGYILPSHVPDDPAARCILEELGMRPVIHAGMHCGEGTGAVALMPLLDMAAAVYREMPTFEEISMKAYEDYTKQSLP